MTTMSKFNIKTAKGRADLAPRRNAYYEVLSKGRALGFRKGPDTWTARLYTPNVEAGTDPFEYQALGQHEDYTSAKKAAEAWFDTATKGAHRAPKRDTVRGALTAYVADLRSHNREAAADDAERRFKKVIDGDPIADIKMDDVTREDFEEWRDRLKADREPRSVNRHVRSVKAGLTKAVRELGRTGNEAAWRLSPLTDDKEGNSEAAVLLDQSQRDRLIAAASPELGAFLRGLEHSGARPSEMAVATVADFNAKQGTLYLKHRKGKGGKLRTRVVTLSTAGQKFFEAQCKDKLPSAPLTGTAAPTHWRCHEWSRAFRKALTAANKDVKPKQRIPAGASTYSFRHARISEMLQVYSIDPLTVAKQTGTSMAMMELYYFKFLPNELLAKLDAVKAAT